MQPFPIFAKYLAHCVAGRQRYADAEAPLGAGGSGVNQVMLVTIVHMAVLIVTGEQYTQTPHWR